MNKSHSLLKSIKWITSVSQRFSTVDRSGRSAVTSKLATLGICFGVMTLIVVMSVMNGFQMSFIDAIMEISSYHVRITDLPSEKEMELVEYCNNSKMVQNVTAFYEAQTMMNGTRGKESAAMIRAVDPKIYDNDQGFHSQIKMLSGKFDINTPGTMVIGSSLARNLGLRVGNKVNLLVLSGGSDVDLFSDDRVFEITGIFTSGYSEINSSLCFINIKDADTYFGQAAKKIWGIKLNNSNDDARAVSVFTRQFKSENPELKIQSWRDYNKTFFGALRIEKNMLLLLVALIFVVVAINIYNGMRRLVFERRSEIAILSAIGASNSEIKAIFIFRGFLTGAIGAFAGLILGLLISINTEFVFNAAARILYWGQYAFTYIFNRQNIAFVSENSSYSVYANIPARLFFPEIFFTTIFGVLAPLFASWAASKNVLKLTVAEVLHNE